MKYLEPMTGMFSESKLMILDFAHIPADLPDTENIQHFFAAQTAVGNNPRLPEHRQVFNNDMLKATGARYLVSQYGEDRSAMLAGSGIAKEGRTLHMGIDIFSKDLEVVYAPSNGEIVRADYEQQDHGYGHYVMFKPDGADVYFFFGHLSKDLPTLGRVKAGQAIATLGDFHSQENGGWTRHLHLQVCTELPAKGDTPIGYSTKEAFEQNSKRFPNPFAFFPDWRVL